MTVGDAASAPIAKATEIYPKCGLRLAPLGWRERPLTGVEASELGRRIAAIEDPLDPERVDMVRQLDRGRVSAHPDSQVRSEQYPEPQPATDDADACRQIMCDLEASGLIAMRAQIRYTQALGDGHSAPIHARVISEALATVRTEHALTVGAQTATMVDTGTDEAVYLFAATKGYTGPRVIQVLDAGTDEERVEARHGEKTVPLPSRGTYGRWAVWSGVPVESAYVAGLCAPRDSGFIGKLVQFLTDNFAPMPSTAPASGGLSRRELHDLVLRENGLSRESCAETMVSDAVSAAGFERRRTAAGIRYRLERRKGQIKRIEHVEVPRIDPAEYAQFLQWRAAQDTPRRRAERAERERVVAEQAKRKTEHESRWGKRDKAQIKSIVQDHQAREQRRATAAHLCGADFAAMPAWYGVPPTGTVPTYAERLARFLAKEEVAS